MNLKKIKTMKNKDIITTLQLKKDTIHIKQTDSKTIHFNLKSNGNLSKPMKYKIIDIVTSGI